MFAPRLRIPDRCRPINDAYALLFLFSEERQGAGTVGGQEEEFSRTVANPSGGQKGTCPGEGDSDGGLIRHTERALRPEASQGPDEVDGNPVHLLRHHTANVVQVSTIWFQVNFCLSPIFLREI